MKGKQDKLTTIIVTYRANNQQLNTIRKSHGTMQPEDLWEKDLRDLISSKSQDGSVIVMGDFNNDLNANGKVNRFFASLSMTEALNERYGEGPPTFAFGSTKIDGIYITADLTITREGTVAPRAPQTIICTHGSILRKQMLSEAREMIALHHSSGKRRQRYQA